MRAAKRGRAEPTHSVVVLAMAYNTGFVHALKKLSLASVPPKCSGFDVLD